MSDIDSKTDGQAKPVEIKQLTLEDLKRVRGGTETETALDDYNRDKCYKKSCPDNQFE